MPIVDLTSTEDLSGAVPLWKVTVDEYTYELYSSNRVLVYKGGSSTPSYEIDQHGCSCPAAQYGKTDCKHRARVMWVGDGVTINAIDHVNNEKGSNALSEDHSIKDIISNLL